MKIFAALLLAFSLPAFAVVVDDTIEISFDIPKTRVNGDYLAYSELEAFKFTCNDGSTVHTATLTPNETEVGYYNRLTEEILPARGDYTCHLTVVATDGQESGMSNQVPVSWPADGSVDPTPEAPTGFGTGF